VKNLNYWFLDAFTNKAFRGNPTVVIATQEELSKQIMQTLAAEFNLSETVFVQLPEKEQSLQDKQVNLRWFTPSHEVKLCGHGTLSAAHILFEQQLVAGERIEFSTASGTLEAQKQESGIVLTFPRINTHLKDMPSDLHNVCDADVIAYADSGNEDGYCVLEVAETNLASVNVDIDKWSQLTNCSFILTSKLSEEEIALRYFAPNHGVDEDPVTGSANVVLADYWSQRSGMTHFRSYQQSKRTGTMLVELNDDKVRLIGEAVTIIKGELRLPLGLISDI